MFGSHDKPYRRQLTHNKTLKQDTLDDVSTHCSILVWDARHASLQRLVNLINGWGIATHAIINPEAVGAITSSSSNNIAVVAIGSQAAPENPGLLIVNILKRKGYRVIAYEEEARLWPLGQQCRPLLAGASWLLDSSRPGFELELRQLLTQWQSSEAERRAQDAATRSVMAHLGLVGESQALLTLFRWVERLSALSDLSTLITGETGTGKELLASAIHRLDPKRSQGPFVVLNCGAISPLLAESELFGHRRGAFTNAYRDRKGLIRTAQHGVLFLDEIGELDLALQTKLLRVLQEGRVLSVGEDTEVPVDVRIIAATNRNLPEMVERGKFRADLFHRLNMLTLQVPPLRERPADLKPLIEHFINKHQASTGGAQVTVGLDFIEAIARIKLPGNVRQLENIVRSSLVGKTYSSTLGLSDLPQEVWLELAEQSDDRPPCFDTEDVGADDELSTTKALPDVRSYLAKLLDKNGWNLSQSLAHCEALLIESALTLSRGNQSKMAQMLGITPRSVYNKVRKHHLRYE